MPFSSLFFEGQNLNEIIMTLHALKPSWYFLEIDNEVYYDIFPDFTIFIDKKTLVISCEENVNCCEAAGGGGEQYQIAGNWV